MGIVRTWRILVLGCLVVGGAFAADDEECLECHDDPDLVREGDWRTGTSVYVDPETGNDSVKEGRDCVECHIQATTDNDERLDPSACADCHEEAAEALTGSLHGQARARGVDDVPGCVDCHGGHDVRYVDDPESPAHRTRVPLTCAVCHASPAFNERRPLSRTSPLAAYEKSVHYEALLGEEEGATCTDCHEYHALYRANDPRSAIHDQRLPATCGRCHGTIQQLFEASIHGRSLAAGQMDAPDCADCHGEHEIRGPDDPASTVSPSRVSKTTCSWCHESERIVKRYGLSSQRQASYEDSYHGLADRAGSTVVANCASCHGVHNILPSSDPLSDIHADNLPETCGQAARKVRRRRLRGRQNPPLQSARRRTGRGRRAASACVPGNRAASPTGRRCPRHIPGTGGSRWSDVDRKRR